MPGLILPELQEQNTEAAVEYQELSGAAHQDNMDTEQELRELFRGIERRLQSGTQVESESMSGSFDGHTHASPTTGISYGLAPTNGLVEPELTWEIGEFPSILLYIQTP
jgi:hypothetical protein